MKNTSDTPCISTWGPINICCLPAGTLCAGIVIRSWSMLEKTHTFHLTRIPRSWLYTVHGWYAYQRDSATDPIWMSAVRGFVKSCSRGTQLGHYYRLSTYIEELHCNIDSGTQSTNHVLQLQRCQFYMLWLAISAARLSYGAAWLSYGAAWLSYGAAWLSGSASACCKAGSILGSAPQGGVSHWAHKRWRNGEGPRRMVMDECILYKCDWMTGCML